MPKPSCQLLHDLFDLSTGLSYDNSIILPSPMAFQLYTVCLFALMVQVVLCSAVVSNDSRCLAVDIATTIADTTFRTIIVSDPGRSQAGQKEHSVPTGLSSIGFRSTAETRTAIESTVIVKAALRDVLGMDPSNTGPNNEAGEVQTTVRKQPSSSTESPAIQITAAPALQARTHDPVVSEHSPSDIFRLVPRPASTLTSANFSSS